MTDAELDQCRHDGALLRSIVSRKVKLKKVGREWKGLCPFHTEKTPSFTVYSDGHYHCFGCGAKGTSFDFIMNTERVEFPAAVKRIETEKGSTSSKSRKASGNGADHNEAWEAIAPPPADAPEPSAELISGHYEPFEYVAANGRRHHYQRRVQKTVDKKDFYPLTYGTLTKNGRPVIGWHSKAPPQPWPLYRLDRLSTADPDSTVMVVEGEGKCQSAERLFPDFVCTSWMGGAGAVDKSDWSVLRRFREERIIYFADADRPREDGRPHGCFIATPAFLKLFPHATQVDTTGLADIKDGYDAKDLEQDVADGRCDDPEAWLRARLRESPTEIASSPLGIWDAGDDDYVIPPRGWLLGNIFCRQFLSGLLADGGVGKTAVRLAQLLSLAVQRSLTGDHVFMRCRVLILSLEDSKDELRRRVYALLLHYGIKPVDVKGWLFLAAPKGIRLAELKDGAPAVGPLKDYLETAIKTLKLDIIALDPFIKTHSVGENDNNAIDFVCDLLATIAIEHDIACDSPHHTNKGLATPGDANRGRGASAHKDAGRLVYTLTPASPEEAAEMGVTDEALRRSLIRMDSAKVNLMPPATAATWFRLVSVPLGNATERYPKGDHIQAAELWLPAGTWHGLDHRLLNLILDDLAAGMASGQRYSSASAATTRAAWPVIQQHAPGKTEKQCRAIISAWLKSGTLTTTEYDDPVERKPRAGLSVNPSKRPS